MSRKNSLPSTGLLIASAIAESRRGPSFPRRGDKLDILLLSLWSAKCAQELPWIIEYHGAIGGRGREGGDKKTPWNGQGKKVEVNVKYINGALEQLKQSAFAGIFPSYQSALCSAPPSPSPVPFNLPSINVIRVICNGLVYFFDNLLLVTLESFYWAFIGCCSEILLHFQ